MILVTGGAGFIGSVLVKELNKTGREDIIIVDRLRDSDKWRNLSTLKYIDYLHSDELFNDDNKQLFNDIDFIFHIGACSATTETDMDYLMKNNFKYSKKIFEIATEKDISIMYASSAATYGLGEMGYSDNHEKVSKLIPINRYGYSKQIFDEWVLKQNDLPSYWYGLKFFNVYGPNEYHKGSMRSIIHKAYEQIKTSGKVKLFKSHKEDFKDGEQLRDFVYVKDVVSVMIILMNIKSSNDSGIYNIGTGETGSFKDLAIAAFNALNVTEDIEFVDMPEELRNQYQYYTKADTSKLNNLLENFKFKSLDDGVKDYILNYLDTEDPYYK